MKTKHEPTRTCLGCNGKFPKKQLIRIVRDKDGNIFLDRTGKASGRGAYICDNPDCLARLIKNKRLSREFECQIPDEIYQKLSDNFNN